MVAVAGVSSGSSSIQTCKPGVKRIDTTLYRTFCGPASAVATVSGKSQSFRQGSCTRPEATFTINMGTLTIGKAKPKYDYFGIALAGANHDGNYPRALVGWAYHGRRYAIHNAKLKLAGAGLAGRSPGG